MSVYATQFYSSYIFLPEEASSKGYLKFKVEFSEKYHC